MDKKQLLVWAWELSHSKNWFVKKISTYLVKKMIDRKW